MLKADLAYAYAKAGKVELARRILEELLEASGRGSAVMTPMGTKRMNGSEFTLRDQISLKR